MTVPARVAYLQGQQFRRAWRPRVNGDRGVLVIRKELLRPGTYYTPSGPVTFTEQDVRAFHASSTQLLASGRFIPVPLDHQDDATPLSHAERVARQVLYNSGWVRGFSLEPGDSLWVELEIDHPEVEKNLHNIKFVSPELRRRFACDGRVWENVVTHVALTTRPVWKDQKPFYVPSAWVGDDGAVTPAPAAAKLSHEGSLRFSLGDALDEEEARSLAAAYRVPPGRHVRFGGRLYSGYVPKQAVAAAEARGEDGRREVMELLRKLASQRGTLAARTFASRLPPHVTGDPEPSVTRVPAHVIGTGHPSLPPFTSPHPKGVPVLAWEDPQGGFHAVSGHATVQRLAHRGEDAPADVMFLDEPTAGDARAVALLHGLISGAVSSDDLAEFYRDTGASPAALHEEMRALGHEPGAALSDRAHALSRLPDHVWDEYQAGRMTDDEALAAGRAASAEEYADEPPPGGADALGQAAPQETLPPVGPGDDSPVAPAGQGGVPGPAEDTGGRSLTDWVSQGLPWGRLATGARLSLDPGVIDMAFPDLPGGGPPPEEKKDPASHEKSETPPEEKGEHAGDPPGVEPPKKGNMPDMVKVLDDLKFFEVPMPSEAYTDLKEFVHDLAKSLTVLRKKVEEEEGGGTEGGAPAAGGPDKDKPPLLEEAPMAGPIPMSLQKELEDLKASVQRLSLERDHAKDMASQKELESQASAAELLVTTGRATRAQADDWKGRLTKHRLSLVEKNPGVEVAMVLSEMKIASAVPEGTFLPKKEVPVPTTAPTSTQLSLEAAPNQTGFADGAGFDQERLDQIKKVFWANLNHIPGLNGRR